jgi:integral membrane protein
MLATDTTASGYARTVRWIAIAEATSFLVLLLCMIPKYAGPHNGVGVSIMGWVHGLLFIGYVFIVLRAYSVLHWSRPRTLLFLIASVVPLAPYFVAHDVAGNGAAEGGADEDRVAPRDRARELDDA